jgi:CO/xanthine dehydrogenase Mo-binding subunit
MTEMLNKEFSRKSFVKGGGAMIVGFSILSGGVGARVAKAAEDPFASNAPYDPSLIDSWIRVHADNSATLLTGRIEFGQGSATGFLQIAAEELDMDVSQLRFVYPDTNLTPDSGSSSAGQGIDMAGCMVRAATAATKQALLGMAAVSLGVPVANLTVKSGVVSGGGRSVTYGQLIGDKLFNVRMAPSYNLQPGQVPGRRGQVGLTSGAPGTKPVSQYTVVGTKVPRIDLPEKITGRFTYVHNIRVPGMLHARVVFPRGQRIYGTAPTLVSVDESSVRHIPDVHVVRKGNFLGVVAPREYDAIQAASQLKVKWADTPPLPGHGNLFAQMRAQDSAGQAPAWTELKTGNVDSALASTGTTLSHSYSFHYNGHLPIGPSCAVADVTPNGAVIFTNDQYAMGLRSTLATLLGLPRERVRVRNYEGSSTYGTGAPVSDAAAAAAIMSQLVGKPVRLQFMRWDEHGWDMYAPAQLIDIRGSIDARGNLVAYDYTTTTQPYYSNAAYTVQMLLGNPFPADKTANGANDMTGAQYNIPNRRQTTKTVPMMNGGYLKTGFVRSPLSVAGGFASEQMIDELAYAAKMDPVEFRRQNVSTSNDYLWVGVWDVSNVISNKERWLTVLDAVTKAASWKPRLAASSLSDDTVVTGRGIALGGHGNQGGGGGPRQAVTVQYAAVVADVEVNKKTGKIVVKHVHTAQDYGLVVGPDLVDSQATGMVVQAISRTLEEVRFNKVGVTSLDWVSYPILRFKDAPKFTNITITRPNITPGPSSEELMGPAPAAIANAFFDATGVRMREAPMTPARVRAVLKAAGVA